MATSTSPSSNQAAVASPVNPARSSRTVDKYLEDIPSPPPMVRTYDAKECMTLRESHDHTSVPTGGPEHKSAITDTRQMYCFAISLQKHVDDTLVKIPAETTRLGLHFARETTEHDGAYDLSGLRRFQAIDKIVIAPEEGIAWNRPVQIRIPLDVLARIKVLKADRMVLSIINPVVETDCPGGAIADDTHPVHASKHPPQVAGVRLG